MGADRMGDFIRALSVARNFLGSLDFLAPSALSYEGHGPSFMKMFSFTKEMGCIE